MYVRIYRKQMAVFRYKINEALQGMPMSEQNKEEHRKQFEKIAEAKPEF